MEDLGREQDVQMMEWDTGLVQDLTREVFDRYFYVKYPPSAWQKVLQTGRRCMGMQKNKPNEENGKVVLNNAELGRLSYILQMTAGNFNNIFGTSIKPSNVPSTMKGFCKQSENEERTNIYRLCVNIFDRHNKVMFVPQMNTDYLKQEWEERRSESERRIEECKATIEEEYRRMQQYGKQYLQAIAKFGKKEEQETTPEEEESEEKT